VLTTMHCGGVGVVVTGTVVVLVCVVDVVSGVVVDAAVVVVTRVDVVGAAVVEPSVVVAGTVDVVVGIIVVSVTVVVSCAEVVDAGHTTHCTCAGTARLGNATHCPAPPSSPSYCVRFNAASVTGSGMHSPSHPPAHVNTAKLSGCVVLHANFRKKDMLANCVQ
jgi:hypothetical protein